MKLKVGTKLRVILTESTRVFNKGERGSIVVLEVSVDNKVLCGNFYPDTSGGFGCMQYPKFKLLKERKPYREIRVTDPHAPHGVSRKLVLRVWPNGVLEIRESGRRSGYMTTVASVYVRLVVSSVFKKRMAKGKRKKST